MNQKTKKQITHWFSVIVIGIALGLALQFVRAWTEPTVAPPGGNVGAPINTGGLTQVKAGTLGINSNGNLVGLTVNGNVGIGTASPSQKLDVTGGLELGNVTSAPTVGTIRWSGTDFEGYMGATEGWKSLTATGGGGGASGSQEFKSSGTWTCPTGVTNVKVTAVGAGGGGGRSYWTGGAVSGGGGGSGGISTTFVTTVPGSVYTVALGAGGGISTGGPNTFGGGGGSTFFKLGTTYLAAVGGGAGGADAGPGGAGGPACTVFGAGGDGFASVGAGGICPVIEAFGPYGRGGRGDCCNNPDVGKIGFLLIEW